jgi:hypothetical protein
MTKVNECSNGDFSTAYRKVSMSVVATFAVLAVLVGVGPGTRSDAQSVVSAHSSTTGTTQNGWSVTGWGDSGAGVLVDAKNWGGWQASRTGVVTFPQLRLKAKSINAGTQINVSTYSGTTLRGTTPVTIPATGWTTSFTLNLPAGTFDRVVFQATTQYVNGGAWFALRDIDLVNGATVQSVWTQSGGYVNGWNNAGWLGSRAAILGSLTNWGGAKVGRTGTATAASVTLKAASLATGTQAVTTLRTQLFAANVAVGSPIDTVLPTTSWDTPITVTLPALAFDTIQFTTNAQFTSGAWIGLSDITINPVVVPTTTTTVPPPATCPAPCMQENFTWFGPHAATTASGDRTVWWNPDRWDVRGDLAFSNDFATLGRPRGFHADIHKAASTALTDGNEVENGSSNQTGGIASSGGVAVMRLNQTGIMSARLRNPLAITSAQPAVVEFYAPKFVTLGHWWEVAISPVGSDTADGLYTAVPNGTLQLANTPLIGNTNGASGPGNIHAGSVPSINIIPQSVPDSCFQDGLGWRLRVGATRKVAGSAAEDIEPKVASLTALPQIRGAVPATSTEVSALARVLVKWRIEFVQEVNATTGKIVVRADLDQNNSFEYVQTMTKGVPSSWTQVYVHLLGAAYEADHHPKDEVNGCYQSAASTSSSETVREIYWKGFQAGPTVRPVAATKVFPREVDGAANNVPRTQGWMSFDARDHQRFDTVSAPLNPPQPNRLADAGAVADGWNYAAQGGLICVGAAPMTSFFYCPATASTKNISVTLPSLAGVTAARFFYDIRRPPTGVVEGTATVKFGTTGTVISLPSASSVAAVQTTGTGWIRRYVNIPVAQLVAGVNNVTVAVTTPNVSIDRLQVELTY